jgi:hypothetical protein
MPPQWQPPQWQAPQQPIYAEPQQMQPMAQQSAQPQSWNLPFPQQMQERPPATQPIDRNGVAPADVSVEKFFYFGNRK